MNYFSIISKLLFFLLFLISIVFLFYLYSSNQLDKTHQALLIKQKELILETERQDFINSKLNDFGFKINQEKHIFEYLNNNNLIH